jgi:C4-type Zn-finger protein
VSYKEIEASRQQWLEEQAHAHRYSDSSVGEVVFEECPVCGALFWAMTKTGGTGFSVVEMTRDCKRCAVVIRAPEIANWVMAVVQKARCDTMKDVEAMLKNQKQGD